MWKDQRCGHDTCPRHSDTGVVLDPGMDWGGLPAVVDEIEGLGQEAMAIAADVSNTDQVERMLKDVLRRFGRIDILVNNAGAPAGPDRVPVVELREYPCLTSYEG